MVNLDYFAVLVLRFENLFERFKFSAFGIDSKKRASSSQDRSSIECSKFQFRFGSDFVSPDHSGVSDEELSFVASGW